ncbi:MAG TPA: hypothetical protein VGO59_10970 [Verrucomicrobiae bacterium]|jgi:hypothetical protein
MTIKSSVMTIFAGAALLCGCVRQPPHRPPPPPAAPAHLHGTYRGGVYASSEGGFSVPRPVSVDINGRILADSPDGVIFVDNWGSRITFKGEAILEHSPMMAMLESQGKEKAMTEYAHRAFGEMITAHYHADVRDGTLSFIYLQPASPKTGVAMFVHGKRLFVAETETLPGVELLAQSDEQSQLGREASLEASAVALAQTMQTP